MSAERPVSRRGFLRGATGATAVAGASGTAAAQETGTPAGGGGGGGGGGTVTVPLVDYAFEGATQSPLRIPPGTTVEFVWRTSNHNIHVDQKPAESDWQGHEPIENAGFQTSHTFTVTGQYHFWCVPHRSLGMVGDIVVEEGATLPGQGGGAATEVDPEHMGVPFQAHFVGLATLVGLFVSLVFTFFFLKYGETPHSGYPEEK